MVLLLALLCLVLSLELLTYVRELYIINKGNILLDIVDTGNTPPAGLAFAAVPLVAESPIDFAAVGLAVGLAAARLFARLFEQLIEEFEFVDASAELSPSKNT